MDNVNVNIPIKIPHSTQSLRDNTFR
ncbi:unnamed protein product, partial [Rotaria magnacalcarata]